jgi:hypothetical protein
LRILVTGGNGFVGRRLVRALAPQHTVHVVDNLRFGRLRFEAGELRAIAVHRADIRDRRALAEVMDAARPEVVIHLAAIHFIPECEADPGLAVDQCPRDGGRLDGVPAWGALRVREQWRPVSPERDGAGRGSIGRRTRGRLRAHQGQRRGVCPPACTPRRARRRCRAAFQRHRAGRDQPARAAGDRRPAARGMHRASPRQRHCQARLHSRSRRCGGVCGRRDVGGRVGG